MVSGLAPVQVVIRCGTFTRVKLTPLISSGSSRLSTVRCSSTVWPFGLMYS